MDRFRLALPKHSPTHAILCPRPADCPIFIGFRLVSSRRSLAYIPTFQGAVHIWGGNSREGNSCRRWLKLFAGFGRGRGQAQGLPLPSADWRAEGRHKAGTYLPLIEGRGQAQGLPLPAADWRGRGQAQGRHLPSADWRAEGRHKACTYLPLIGEAEGRHKACPYLPLIGEAEGRHKACPLPSADFR